MRNRRRHGVTLIETIAAVVMLSVAVPPILFSISNANRQRIDVMKASQARWLITSKLEDIIADRHSTTRGYDYLIAANYPAESPIASAAGFTRSVSFSEKQANLTTNGTGYMIVTVTVGWTDSKAAAKSMAISTVLTEYDT